MAGASGLYDIVRCYMANPRKVAVLAFPGMAPFELGVVVEVFGLARPELAHDPYELTVFAEQAGPLAAIGGFSLTPSAGLEALRDAGTVVIPGCPDKGAEPSAELKGALRDAHARGARMVSICSGAFTLAAAGLLDGREAATHWRFAPLLAERYPKVRVRPDVLYVDDGDVLSSAGSAAGIDLCLHLVRLDHGSEVANAVARGLVVAPHRDGGQAQFIELPVSPRAGDQPVGRAMDWALERLGAPLSVGDLARQAHMSPRTFARRFHEAVGMSPGRWLSAQRVAASLPLLEGSDDPVEHVGSAVGFPNPANFRAQFRRHRGLSPAAYRRAFRARRQERPAA
jgi:AraC family transcriptional activator FtrA